MGASVINVYFKVVMPANRLRVNHCDLWHFARCGEFSKGLMCLSKFQPGTVEKNSSPIRFHHLLVYYLEKNSSTHTASRKFLQRVTNLVRIDECDLRSLKLSSAGKRLKLMKRIHIVLVIIINS